MSGDSPYVDQRGNEADQQDGQEDGQNGCDHNHAGAAPPGLGVDGVGLLCWSKEQGDKK